MPPRSYYLEPRPSDYLAFAQAYFSDDFEPARAFVDKTGNPFVEGPNHLAAYLGISPSLIRQILHKKSYHYRTFEIPKGIDEFRQITTPKTYLKVIQWWILDNILATSELNPAVHGFTRGRSHVSNAREHLGAKHILNVDIQRFFPSISTLMIENIFCEIGYGNVGANLLAELCSLEGSAPTGAPTSPSIGNLVLREFDVAATELAQLASYKYTRYADDLTFSSQTKIPLEFCESVNDLVVKFGFKLNEGKTKFMGAGDRMEVTGVVINQFPNTTREWRNWARGYLHRAEKNPHQYMKEWQRVSGIFGTLKSVDPTENLKLTKKAKSTLKLLKPKS